MAKREKTPKRGRPKGSGMEGGARRQLYLDDATWAALEELGAELGGRQGPHGAGRSAAVRKLVEDWRASKA